jgi:molybdate transport system substrate-binding protein
MKRASIPAAIFTAVMLVSSACAAELKVLSAGAVESAMPAFARLVKQETGNDLKVEYNTTPRITERLAAGEVFDIVIAPPAVIAQAAKDGKALADTRVPIGRVGAGAFVRSGAPVPDVRTVDALKQAMLGADSIVYNTASTGQYIERMVERIGIAAALKPKTTRYADGAAVMEHVLEGNGNEIGFGAITEIRLYEGKGARLVGPLPADVQNYTSYDAVVMAGAPASAAAKSALALAATPHAKAAFVAAGVE